MPTLTQLVTLDAQLTRALRRLEGQRAVAGPRHVQRQHAHLVEAPHAVATAVARFLVWRAYLRSRRPTHASAMRAGHYLRGALLWRMALLAHAQGRVAKRSVPAFVLLSPHPVARAVAGDTPNDSGDDASTWWDENAGDVYGPDFEYDSDLYDTTLRQLTAAEKAQLLTDVGTMLDFDNWINDSFLTDLQVLQLLDEFWNGKTIASSGQSFLDEAGIAGDFDILDQNMLQFLRVNAGEFVTHIDAVTRTNLAEQLWKGLGGDGEQPLAMDALATYLQNNLGGKLAGMSDQRARMIAITETARAESFGNFIAMLQSGVQEKIWITTTGACSICVTNEEQGNVPLRDPFPSGDLTPPAHPICRCSAAAAIPDGFDPNQWAYAPSDLQMDNIFSNPSFALWPREVANLDQPDLKVAPDPSQVNLIQWQDLPQRVQAVLQPAVLDKIKDVLGEATNVDDFLAKLAALKAATTLPSDVTAAPTGGPTIPATQNETPLLSADEVLQNLMDHPPESTLQEKTDEETAHFLQQFKSVLSDLQQFMEDTGHEERAIPAAWSTLRLQLALLTRNYEYTTADGTEHEVTTGAGGKWIDNQVIGHIGGTPPPNHLPHDYAALLHMTPIAGPKGANAGQWYRDGAGHEFYVKPAQDAAHAYNEVGAMRVYQVAGAQPGVDIPYTTVLAHDGTSYIVSQKIAGLAEHAEAWWQSPAGTTARATAAHLWGVDALLSHWDVTGNKYTPQLENIPVHGESHPVRIEAGGAMAYSGLGTAKAAWSVGANWVDPWSMRGVAHGPDALWNSHLTALFGHITNAEAAKLLQATGKAVKLAAVEAAWQHLGMPPAQIKINLAVLADRLKQIPGIVKQLQGKATPQAAGAKASSTKVTPIAGVQLDSVTMPNGKLLSSYIVPAGAKYAVVPEDDGTYSLYSNNAHFGHDHITLAEVKAQLKALGIAEGYSPTAKKSGGGAKATASSTVTDPPITGDGTKADENVEGQEAVYVLGTGDEKTGILVAPGALTGQGYDITAYPYVKGGNIPLAQGLTKAQVNTYLHNVLKIANTFAPKTPKSVPLTTAQHGSSQYGPYTTYTGGKAGAYGNHNGWLVKWENPTFPDMGYTIKAGTDPSSYAVFGTYATVEAVQAALSKYGPVGAQFTGLPIAQSALDYQAQLAKSAPVAKTTSPSSAAGVTLQLAKETLATSAHGTVATYERNDGAIISVTPQANGKYTLTTPRAVLKEQTLSAVRKYLKASGIVNTYSPTKTKPTTKMPASIANAGKMVQATELHQATSQGASVTYTKPDGKAVTVVAKKGWNDLSYLVLSGTDPTNNWTNVLGSAKTPAEVNTLLQAQGIANTFTTINAPAFGSSLEIKGGESTIVPPKPWTPTTNTMYLSDGQASLYHPVLGTIAIARQWGGGYAIEAQHGGFKTTVASLPELHAQLATYGIKSEQLDLTKLTHYKVDNATIPKVNQLVLTVGSHDATFTVSPTGKVSISVAGDAANSASGLTATGLQQWLDAHGLTYAQTLIDSVIADAQRYTAPVTSPEQQARIDAITARKAELVAKFGEYSQFTAQKVTGLVLNQFDYLKKAIESHLHGGSGAHLNADNIAKRFAKTVTKAQAQAALKDLHDVTEWALLHHPAVTREGTMRLWHGTNGDLTAARWHTLFANGTYRAGMPFSDLYRISRQSFTEKGKGGWMVLSAQVPVNLISTYYKMLPHSGYSNEHEYIVGGPGVIADLTVIDLHHNNQGEFI